MIGGSEWASPIVVTKKKNGKLGVCCDYKVSVNKQLMSDVCNTPSLETVFAKLGNAKHFAKFDLKSAFWQLELDEKSKRITTINTTKGLYQFNRLPYGLKVSSAVFQRAMEKLVAGMEGIIVWQNDILVFADDLETLNKRVQQLLKKLNKKNVQINWEKSIRCADTVVFLGHKISSKGIAPDPRLVSTINAIKAPRCVKDVERFIGLVNNLVACHGIVATNANWTPGKCLFDDRNDGCRHHGIYNRVYAIFSKQPFNLFRHHKFHWERQTQSSETHTVK